MTLPANIRVNLNAPFPALVQGSGPISVGKANGIWTVGFSVTQFGIQNPPSISAFPTDYFFVWDSAARQFILVPLSSIAGGARRQRSVTASPVVISPTDLILNVNLGSAGTCTIPAFATRVGVPLTFKMLPGSAGLTLNRTSPDTFDGNTSLNLVAGQSLTLMPYNDGVNAGWAVE